MKRLIPFLVVALLFASIFAGSMVLSSARADSTGFDDISVLDATVAGDLNVAGASTLIGATSMRAPIAASLGVTLTAGQTISPAYGAYIISSSGAVSMTLAACNQNGRTVTLYGDDANTVTVNDSNTYTSDGNAVTFGQYDVVVWQCFNTKWNLVSKSANS